jgi:hypothetical protein
VADPLDAPELPCPECRLARIGGGARIGNRRNKCTTCNNFVQNVIRLTGKYFRDRYPEEYRVIRLEAELELYQRVLLAFIQAHPESRAEGTEG